MAYGTYRLAKSGKLNELAELGKGKVNELLGNKANAKEALAGNADDILKGAEKVKKADVVNTAEKVKNAVASGFKKLSQPETLEETLKNTNLLSGKEDGKNNCSTCAIAAFLRGQGYDVHSTSVKGEMQNLLGIVEECFSGAVTTEGSAIKFGKSRNDAAEMLLRKYGRGIENPKDINAEGAVSVQWLGGGGHIFNWKIEKGEVSFFDAQKGLNDDRISLSYWNMIDKQGALQLARLDGAEIKDEESLKKYISF